MLRPLKKNLKGVLKMFEKILFDLDGTLTDPKTGITKCVQYALNHFGIEEEADNLTKFIGPPLIDSFMEFYGFSLDKARQAAAKYRERFAPIGKFENEVYEGIPEMLKELKEKGVVLAIASSKPEPFVNDILIHFGLRDYFDVVVGSLMNETRTKKEEVIEEALKRLDISYEGSLNAEKGITLNVPKESVAMVGDRKFDVASARDMGITAVGVSFGYAQKGELEAENPDFIAKTVAELKEYLLNP